MSESGKWGKKRAGWFGDVGDFDVSKLAKKLESGANIDWRDPKQDGATALSYYAKCDFEWGVRWLISRGAGIHVLDRNGRDALSSAAGAGARSAAIDLLRAGADPNRIDDWGQDALSRAHGRCGMPSYEEEMARMVFLLAPLCGKRSARRALGHCVDRGDIQKAKAILECVDLSPAWIIAAGRPRAFIHEEQAAKWLRNQGMAMAESRQIRSASMACVSGERLQEPIATPRPVRL